MYSKVNTEIKKVNTAN